MLLIKEELDLLLCSIEDVVVLGKLHGYKYFAIHTIWILVIRSSSETNACISTNEVSKLDWIIVEECICFINYY